MHRIKLSHALPAFLATIALATTASAQTTPSSSPGTPSTSDTVAGPSAAEPESRDTVTVTRSIRPNRPWLIAGSSILIGSYVTTAIIESNQGRTVEDRNLLIPVAGPWLNLADRRCDGCDNETRNVALVIGSGVLQGVGAGMALASFFIPEKIAAATIQAGPVHMLVTPTSVGQGSMGVGTVGVF